MQQADGDLAPGERTLRVFEIASNTGDVDLTNKIQITSRDEIGQLARSFDHMIGRLREALALVERRTTPR